MTSISPFRSINFQGRYGRTVMESTTDTLAMINIEAKTRPDKPFRKGKEMTKACKMKSLNLDASVCSILFRAYGQLPYHAKFLPGSRRRVSPGTNFLQRMVAVSVYVYGYLFQDTPTRPGTPGYPSEVFLLGNLHVVFSQLWIRGCSSDL